MAVRKRTLRKMRPVVRQGHGLAHELERLGRRLRNCLDKVDRLESDGRVL